MRAMFLKLLRLRYEGFELFDVHDLLELELWMMFRLGWVGGCMKHLFALMCMKNYTIERWGQHDIAMVSIVLCPCGLVPTVLWILI